MTKIIYECLYCGNKWDQETQKYRWADLKDKCPKCDDRDIRTRKYDSVDYYEGSPPFED